MSDPRLLAASDYLRHLLNNEPTYRGIWLSKARRSGGSPNVTAVSAVLAEYHWQNDYLLDSEPPSTDRGYKDRVARALGAKSFTPETVRLFGHAFRMKDRHVNRLLELLTSQRSDALIGWPMLGNGSAASRRYRTVSLHELHTIGPDRVPTEHRTIHAIQAIEDGVDSYVYAFDTPHVTVKAVQGARAGALEPLPGSADFWMVRLSFDRPLVSGEFRFFEYLTRFEYPMEPPSEFRRAVARPLQTLSMRVTFAPERRPTKLTQASWSSLEDKPVDIGSLSLDDEHAVYVVIEDAPAGSIHGIRWEWD